MIAREKNLLRYLEGTDKNFIIPVYQRNYDWKISHCKQLLDDLISIIDDNYRSHFMGSIVHVYNQESIYYEYMIIDGQQRLTTISILLLAIYNLIKNKVITTTSINIDKICNEYLIDKYAPADKKIKLKPIKDDCIAFERLFDEADNYIEESNITHNYNFFYEQLLKLNYSIDAIYKAIECLIMVEIELKAQEDDPQLIFESLNSTGLGLTEADKVRNYILMKQDRITQENYYNKYWNKIEINTNYNVSAFLRDYLTIKRNKIPNINDVYFVFKSYHKSSIYNMEDILIDLLEYSKIYNKIINSDYSNKIFKTCVLTINRLETYVTYPFLLELFMDLQNGIISEEQCGEVLITIRNYIFRRIICEIPTNSLNKTFMTLNNDIKKHKDYSHNYSDICKYIFLTKDTYQRFPNDKEFSEKFIERDIYNQQSKNKLYLLTELENYENKERVDIEGLLENGTLSIEHIMPQELSDQWKIDLGSNYAEIYEKYLHTIGNITLTGYNSEMKNAAFLKKRDAEKGFKNSRLKLNKYLSSIDKWTEQEIKDRANQLKEDALKIWSYPITNYTISDEQTKFFTLDDEKNFTNEKITSYSFIDANIKVDSWTDFFISIVKQIAQMDMNIFDKILSERTGDSRLEKIFSRNEKKLRSPKEVTENLYAETNLSTEDKLLILRKLVEQLGLALSDIGFYIS